MSVILYAFTANLIWGLLAIPWYINVAKRKQIVDVPNHRSSHTKITPRGGGIFLVIGSLSVALFLGAKESNSSHLLWIASSACIAFLGFADDLRPLPSRIRLAIQTLPIVILFLFHYSSTNMLPPSTIGFLQSLADNLAIATLAISIWILGCLNIYNFMDGIDGLACLQGIAATIAWGTIAYLSQNEFLLIVASVLGGGLVAFLTHNWAPAKIFMGDCASSFLGFCFATFPIIHALHAGSDLWQGINLTVLCLFPFLFDGSFTLLRRISKKEDIFKAHRTHLYQRWTLHWASKLQTDSQTDSHRYVSAIYGLWALTGSACSVSVYQNYTSLSIAYITVSIPAAILLVHSRKFPN